MKQLLFGGVALVALTAAASVSIVRGHEPAVELVDADLTNIASGDVLLRGVVLVKAASAPDAALIGTFLNKGRQLDRLTGVEVVPADVGPGPAPAPIVVALNVALPRFEAVRVGHDGTTQIRIPGLGRAPGYHLGTNATVTFTFRDAGSVRASVLVTNLDYLTESIPLPNVV